MGVTNRIFQLHQLFRTGQFFTLQHLIEKMEVSKATIKRDFDLLRDQLRAPLIYDRYENAYRYEEQETQFELPGLWFNASELHALLSAEQLLETVQPGLLAPHISPLKARIRTLLEKSGHSSETVTSRIILQLMGHRHLESECFGSVAGAVLDGHAMDIHYHARGTNQGSDRRIHPQRLLYYRDNWYVIAWCEKAQALRTFALDRIRRAKVLTQPVHHVDEQVLQQHLNAGFGIFAGESENWAVLRFTPRMARWVADEQWHPQQMGRWQGEHYELHVPYADSTELLMDILKYGPEVEVLAPSSLKTQLLERLEQTLRQYQ